MCRPTALYEELVTAPDYKWWGNFAVPHGESRRWQIGPLLLIVRRLTHEWRVVRAGSGMASETALEVSASAVAEPEPAGALISRYATFSTAETLVLTPVLPDLSVVSRPERPIRVLPRQNVTIYVGSPIWIRLEEAPHTLLEELPPTTPTKTWWGPNTMEGEPCYATRTHGRLQLEDAAQFPHRAITAVEVQNASDDSLLIERLNLPVRRLSLYAARDGRLWTENVRLERASHQEFAQLSVDDSPPSSAAGAVKLCGPRESNHQHLSFRAFGSLFK
jgi:hypothetical protein